MTTKEQGDEFAIEMSGRFDAFTRWAIENWPIKNAPLLASDFEQSRREVAHILGAKLAELQENTPADAAPDDNPQYIAVTPAPWP